MTEEWRNDILQNADFDQEYSMLAYTLAEVQAAAKPATTAVQNYIASKVVERFHQAYDKYTHSYNPNSPQNRARTFGDPNKPMAYHEYFARNRQAYMDVLAQPLDLSLAGMTRDTYGNPTPAEYFPEAFRQDTVGKAMNWLTMSEVPGMLTSLAKPIYGKHPSLMGPDGKPILDDSGIEVPDPNQRPPLIGRQASNLPADELNAAWMRGYETIHLFEPGDKRNFTVWFNSQAKRGIEKFREAEQAWRSGSTPFSYAFNEDGDTDEGGNAVDMMTGEYMDGGAAAGENAGAIGDVSRFSTHSLRPNNQMWGIDWSVPGGIRNSMNSLIQGLIYKNTGKDNGWDTFNVQTGRYGQASGAGNLQVYGIDPNSPAGKAGMQEGAFIQSLQRIFEHPQLSNIVDELQNGMELKLPVMQKNERGELVEQMLTIQPGSMAGRGIEDNPSEKQHWIDNLADYVDRSSMKGVQTDLFTNNPAHASGMYKDSQGNWHLAKLRRGGNEEFKYPVTLTPDAMRQFVPLYDEQKAAWSEYQKTYDSHWRQAYSTQLNRYLQAKRRGDNPKTPFLDAVKEMTLRTLPKDIPRPGSEPYEMWQSGQGMLGEIREFEDNINGAPASGDFYDRTIEQWDAWASSMERFKTPGVYGYVDPKRLAQAQAEVVTSEAGSRAGNYLTNDRKARLAGLISRMNPEPKGTLQYPAPAGMADGAPVKGSGGATLGKTLRLDPATGEIRKVYPEVAMSRFYLNAPREPLPPTPRKTLAQQAADRELYYTVQQAPFQGNPAGSAFDLSGLSQQTDNAFMFPRSPGRGKRLIENLAAQRRAGTPAPDFQGNPTTGPILPARPTGKYKDPAPRPWYQPPGPNEFVSPLNPSFSLSRMASDENYAGQVLSASDRFSSDQAELELAAYSQISNRNAMSSFPLGSMNEDDFPWTTKDQRPREEKARVENTFDTSVMGGDPEGMVEIDENHIGMGDAGQFQTEGYFKPYPIEGVGPGVNVLGMLQDGKLIDLNEMNFRSDMSGDALSLENQNRRPKGDPTMAARVRYDAANPGRDVDTELEGVSDEIMQGESENRFQQAWRVLFDPKRPDATLSEKVSTAGNELGFLAHSKAAWGEIFTEHSKGDWKSSNTHYALNDADRQIQAMSEELEGNIGALARAERKRSVVLTRLGEGPELARDMEKSSRTRAGLYHREALKQIAGEVKAKTGIDLAVQVGREATLFDQLVTLRKDFPEAFQMVKGQFAPLGDQLKISRQFVGLMNNVPGAPAAGTGNTPAPKRAQPQSPGDSHVFRGPDGKGRAMLKWSPNDEFEMRRGRGSVINPETGEFDPFALENTPVANQVRARGGGSGRPGWSRPDYQDLNALQNSIAYRHFENRQGDNQRSRLEGQVSTYITDYMDKRKRFDLIMPYDVDGDQSGAGLQALLQEADSAVRSAFGAGFDIGTMEEVSDPDLPEGYVRIGSTVRREGEGPEYVNDFTQDRDPGEPPEAPPPPDQTPPGAGNNGGQPPEEPPAPPDPADQNGTPRPNRSNGSGPGRTPKPKPNNDPAAFPMQPGAEGWKMTFSRYDPATRKGKSVSVWGRKDDQGNLGWYERNAEGNMEPLQINKGWGKVYDEKGTLLHDVDRNAREYYDAMNAPLVSSDGNSGTGVPGSAAGNTTPTPSRQIIRTPEEWASFTPEAGMMMVDRSQGYPKHYFATEDPDKSGEMKWVTSAKNGGIQEDAPNPGWGQIIAPDGSIVADVPQHKYEIYANEQGLERSARNKRLREEARVESERRNAELKAQRRVAQSSPAPSISGFSASFGRFNNSMWEISGRFMSRFLQSHSPQEFGETEIGENTKLAAANEYLAQATHIYNSYIGNPPTSAQQIIDDIVDMTGADESVAKPIAEALYGEHQEAKRRGVPLKQQNPMRRSMERAGRLSDMYDSQDIGAGPLGMRTHVQNKVGDVSIRDIDGFKSPSLGEGHYTGYVDDKGEYRYVPRIAIEKTNQLTGERGLQTTVDQTQIAKGLGWAQNAFNSAFSGDLPSSPDAILATLKERMYSEMSKQMKADIDNAVKHGANRTDAGVAAQVTKEVGDHFLQKIVGKVKDALGVTVGEADSSAVAEGTRYDHRIKTLDELKGKLGSDPVFAKEFKGKSAEEINKGDEMVVYDADGRSLKVGGNGREAYGTRNASDVSSAGNRPGNMFGQGKWGSTFYGAYLLKREWQMATGATFAAANAWGEGMADYAGLMYSGSPMGGTDMGFSFRQEAGESFMGKAAYSSWGAYMDIPYRMSQTGNMSLARLVQNTGIAGGVAMGGAITGSMLTAGGMAAAGGALATGGLVLGGAILAAAGGMEVYNNFFKPDDLPDVTFSTPVQEYRKSVAVAQAAKARSDALWGPDYETYKKNQVANKKPIIAYQDWRLHKIDDPLQTTGNVIPLEDLMPYMDAEGKAVYEDEEQNKRAAELSAKVREIYGETGETDTALKKALAVQKGLLGELNPNALMGVSQASSMLGISSEESLMTGATYAQQMGYLQGTPDYARAVYKYANTTDRVQRQQMQYTASRVNQFGSQIQAMMGTSGNFVGQGARIAAQYDFQTQAQAGAFTSMVGGMQAYGAELAPWQYDSLANLSQSNNPFVSQVLGNAMEGFMMAGGSAGNAIDLGWMMSGMSTQDASVYGRMMQGDLKAYSYQAWQSGNMDNAFFDKAGRSITQYYGSIANQVYNHWVPTIGRSPMTASQFLGTSNPEILAAWNAPDGNGGFYGLQKLANEKSYAASMASIGIQLKGIALSENFYWGANQGGTWNNPATHSAWGIEDQMLQLQDTSTRAGFEDQWTRMTRSNDYAIRRENNQFQRMNASQAFQNYQWSYSYNQFQQSQQWAQEDWQYQDTMRGLSFGWQMEDLNEQIRFASGRQRKQLVKQRDRAALTHNIEDEQIETTRDRQKELWAQQEEQYQKQREYNLELQRLDQESFAMNKEQREEFYKLDVQSYERRVKEYEEEKKLQDELRELQRKFQYDQLQLQKEAAGAQAAAAAAQKEINDAILEGQKNWETLTGEIEQMNTYNNAYRIANATNEMMRMIDNVNVNKINKILELIRTIGTVDNPRYGGERD